MASPTGIIIQARTGSTRLPQKMILDFYQGQGIFALIVDQLVARYQGQVPIILATTQQPADDALVAIAKQKGIGYYRGSEADVLQRFIDTAEAYELDYIIRVCADNPFLDTNHIQNLIDLQHQDPSDYISYAFTDKRPVIASHLGLFTEMTSLKTLKKVSKMTTAPLYHEHVTNYIYNHPAHFKMQLLALPDYLKNRQDLRLTLDTVEDFTLLQKLYHTSVEKGLSLPQLVAYIDTHPAYLESMQSQIKQNTK